MSLLQNFSRRFLGRVAMTAPAIVAAIAFTTFSANTVHADGLEVTEQDTIFGEAESENTFIEYASMTCPHCARFHAEGGLYQKIKEQFVDSGQARFVYRDLPWDGMAFRAALMTRCIPAEKQEAMISLVYKTQPTWSKAPEELVKTFAIVGMTAEEAEACVNDKEMQEYILEKRTEALDDLGVTGTPYLFFNGKKVDMQKPEEEILADLEAKLK